MKIVKILILFLFIVAMSGYAQTDTVFLLNGKKTSEKIINQGKRLNSLRCKISRKDTSFFYKPSEISGYKFYNGEKYISNNLHAIGKNEKYFLEIVCEGEISIYQIAFDEKTYYLYQFKDQNVKELKQAKGKLILNEEVLELFDNNTKLKSQQKNIKYQRNPIRIFFTNINQNKNTPIPKTKVEVHFGIGIYRIQPNKIGVDISRLTFRNYSGITFGIAINHPIFNSFSSLRIEANYFEYSFSENSTLELDNPYEHVDLEYDMILNAKSIQVPLLYRYTLPKEKFRPFINFGLLYTYNFKNETLFSKSSKDIETNNITLDFSKELILNKNQFGLSAGIGSEISLKSRFSGFIEIRFDHSRGEANKSLLLNQIYCKIGLSI
jgi:hypothetical protein